MHSDFVIVWKIDGNVHICCATYRELYSKYAYQEWSNFGNVCR